MSLRLFCPKCGDLMAPSGETMKCVKGEMELSLRLFESLKECYLENIRSPMEITFTYNGKPHGVGGRWFCPACGVEIKEERTGVLKCPKCSKSLVGFVYDLIERHPHRNADGAWR
jgi:predicted RNA-binding Zn-ribbon protein involved in translation (DUF1610 family)